MDRSDYVTDAQEFEKYNIKSVLSYYCADHAEPVNPDGIPTAPACKSIKSDVILSDGTHQKITIK